MKRIIAIILIVVSCLCISGYTSVGQFSGVEVEVMEDYDTGYNTWNTIRLNDKYISLPCSVKLFTDLGYKVEKDIYDLAPNKMMSAIWFTDASGNVLELSVVNLNSNIMPVTDCYVYKVTWRAGYNGDIDVCGVGQGATPIDVQSTIGEPVHKGDSLYGSVMRMYETSNDDRELQVTYDTNDVAVEFTVICEAPELNGYQSQYESAIDSIRASNTSKDNRGDSNTKTTLLPEDEEQPDVSNALVVAIVFVVVAVPSIAVIAIIAIICHVVKKFIESKSKGSRENELKEAHRLLNTDLEELVDDINDD